MQTGAAIVQTNLRNAFEGLQRAVPAAQALVVIGPDGTMMDCLAVDPSFDIEIFTSEYAMLLRIARSTSHDTGSGDLIEQILVSDNSIAIARNLPSDYALILVSNKREQLGRARYELKCLATQLERTMRARS
jgi:predicted regulator of Ras-like GTPase activity (Roadblock/LC7/MglB family)